MFLRFPFHDIGFSDDEWEELPRGDRVLIRDYYLNGKDSEQTLLYAEYDTAYQVRKIERRYELKSRPEIHFVLSDFHFC